MGGLPGWWPRARGVARCPARCCPAGPGLCCGAGAHSARLRGHGSVSTGCPAVTPPNCRRVSPPTPLTVLVHAGLQALLEPAGLALVAMGFVHRAQPRPRLAPVGRGDTLAWPLSFRGVLPSGLTHSGDAWSLLGVLSPHNRCTPHNDALPQWAPCPQQVPCPNERCVTRWVPCPLHGCIVPLNTLP